MKSQLMYSSQKDAYRAERPPLSFRMRMWVAGLFGENGRISRHAVVALILAVSLIAFEIFNFDTTRFALSDFLGEASFMGISWAAILAIAFCSIDFAGLVRMFTPEQGADEPKAVWYLMGAWLLGATMNAVMTWWAVSLTLLNHDFGNEVLSREQLLRIVPIFVAVLVWLTRILFIGAVTVTGEKLINRHRARRNGQRRSKPVARASRAKPKPAATRQAPPPPPTSRGRAQIKERNGATPSRRPRPKPKPAPKMEPSAETLIPDDEYPTVVAPTKSVPRKKPPTRTPRPATNPNTARRVKRRPPTAPVNRPPSRGRSASSSQSRR